MIQGGDFVNVSTASLLGSSSCQAPVLRSKNTAKLSGESVGMGMCCRIAGYHCLCPQNTYLYQT